MRDTKIKPATLDADALSGLDSQIQEAWLELLAARSDCLRSLNADSIRTEQYAEMRLNRMLERRYAEWVRASAMVDAGS